MKTQQSDLTIDDVMGDPLIRSVMRADRVEPRQLETMLRRMAVVRRDAAGPVLDHDATEHDAVRKPVPTFRHHAPAMFHDGAAPLRPALCGSACG